jgi:hypothetical protein
LSAAGDYTGPTTTAPTTPTNGTDATVPITSDGNAVNAPIDGAEADYGDSITTAMDETDILLLVGVSNHILKLFLSFPHIHFSL